MKLLRLEKGDRILRPASRFAGGVCPGFTRRPPRPADFDELGQSNRWGDPWDELCRNLERLALFTRADGQGHRPQLVRMHRLVQELIRGDLSLADQAAFQSQVLPDYVVTVVPVTRVTRGEVERDVLAVRSRGQLPLDVLASRDMADGIGVSNFI